MPFGANAQWITYGQVGPKREEKPMKFGFLDAGQIGVGSF